MDVTECGMFQVSSFDFNDFETMVSSIREIVYLFYKNFQKTGNARNWRVVLLVT